MESFLYFLSISVVTVGAVLYPCFMYPVQRVEEIKGRGFVLEQCFYGVWVRVSNLSDEANLASNKVAKLKKDLNKAKQDEKIAIDRRKKRVAGIQDSYASFLATKGNKYDWHFLWRKVPIPAWTTEDKVKAEVAAKEVRRAKTTGYTIEACQDLGMLMTETGAEKVFRWATTIGGNQNKQNNNGKQNNNQKGGGQQNGN